MAAVGSQRLGVGLFLGFGKCAERQWRAETSPSPLPGAESWSGGGVEGRGPSLTTELARSCSLAAALVSAQAESHALSFHLDKIVFLLDYIRNEKSAFFTLCSIV